MNAILTTTYYQTTMENSKMKNLFSKKIHLNDVLLWPGCFWFLVLQRMTIMAINIISMVKQQQQQKKN